MPLLTLQMCFLSLCPALPFLAAYVWSKDLPRRQKDPRTCKCLLNWPLSLGDTKVHLLLEGEGDMPRPKHKNHSASLTITGPLPTLAISITILPHSHSMSANVPRRYREPRRAGGGGQEGKSTCLPAHACVEGHLLAAKAEVQGAGRG